MADDAAFSACLAGPAVAVETTCTRVFDFDADGDMDAVDASTFTLSFTGSS